MNILTIEPGGIVTGLYTETIPLGELGALHIERLTTIEFNEATQQWDVKDRAGEQLFADPSRVRCLEWEHEHFNQ
jgi:uncharacterized protein (DUF1919 family)